MSQTTYKLLEFISMFIAYTGIVLVLPAVMFRRILSGRRAAEQFLMCYTFGNFYIINIVFVVQLLHISNMFTLIALTAGLSFIIWSRIEKVSVRKKILEFGTTNKKVLLGTLGLKTVFHRVLDLICRKVKQAGKIFEQVVIRKSIQWLFLGILFVGLFWMYGRQIILVYGYRASDIPVHMSWINQMSRGNLFSSGVYPFGFHCMVYYLHTVFRFDVYTILCQFFFAQVIYAHLVMLAFLKLCCKSNYLPYAGTLVYLFGSFWARQTYSRYYSTLPQEFGMIFVLPSIWFLIRFFQTKKKELKSRETLYQLSCFAMAFSLTLAIHFYGTMIAGLCCIGIAGGFCVRFLQKDYFRRIMLTGIISVFLAVLPMGIAFATGTPLQGSLGWGMSVIKGGDKEAETEDTTSSGNQNQTTDASDQSAASQGASAAANSQTDAGASVTPATDGSTENGNTSITETGQEQRKIPTISELKEKTGSLVEMMAQRINTYIVTTDLQVAGKIVLLCIVALIPLGILFCIFRRREYGELLLSVSFYMGILTILLCSGELGLPTLMDAARCSIYYVYLFIAAPVLLLDGIVYLLCMFPVMRIPRNIISFVTSAAILLVIFQNQLIKEPDFKSDFVTNGAITCLDNIIYENEDRTWTIVSANDETQMGLDHGWHYETISFLREMESVNKDTEIIIPTKTVYFFIEKIPLNYAIAYSGSGQSISEKGASQPLPNVGGIGMYQGERRWILMSRMYFWAQAFQEKYPNEMQVYYESDEFVCYKIEQNMYHLYNFAIDYGYNNAVTGDTEKK